MSRFHSVRLEKELCKGCTSCIKRCPTGAIRVRDGRARIIDERCIDCGECIRICPYHAKVAVMDPWEMLSQFKYRIALPAPSFYGQFKTAESLSDILSSLILCGFDHVFEVARAADIVSKVVSDRLKSYPTPRPLISSACPTVTRLIQVRFPDLIDHIVPVRQPVELAASIARREYAQKHGVDKRDIGVFFISPCAAKMTAVRTPVGQAHSEVDGVLSMLDVFGRCRPLLHDAAKNTHPVAATPYGVSWARSGGEMDAVGLDNSLAVDGIENVIRVLEEVENNKLHDLDFLECAACVGGCVGGPLTFENPYVARNTLHRLCRQLPLKRPEQAVSTSDLSKDPLLFDAPLTINHSFSLDSDLQAAMEKMERMNEIYERLPALDCGACGSPTCRDFAEDVAQGYCKESECIIILKQELESLLSERGVSRDKEDKGDD